MDSEILLSVTRTITIQTLVIGFCAVEMRSSLHVICNMSPQPVLLSKVFIAEFTFELPFIKMDGNVVGNIAFRVEECVTHAAPAASLLVLNVPHVG